MTVDLVNHPSHYNAGKAKCQNCNHPIETIEVTEHMNFNMGNAVKYIWRADEKGNDILDLQKAAWYINREIERRQRENSANTPDSPTT